MLLSQKDAMFESVARPQMTKRRLGAGTIVSLLMHIGSVGIVVWLTRYAPPKTSKEFAVAFLRPALATPPQPPPTPPERKTVRSQQPAKPLPNLPPAIVVRKD